MRYVEYGNQNPEPVILLHGGGLSPGGQIAVEMLTQRPDVSRFALLESTLVKPSKLTYSLLNPSFGMSYGLITQKWFAKMQAAYLGIPQESVQ